MFWLLLCVALLACLWLASIVGQISSLRWPHHRFRVATAAQASPAHADLFERAEQELSALGFEPLGWVGMDEPDGAHPSVVMRVLVHHASGTTALLSPGKQLQRPNELMAVLATSFADGRRLTSVPNMPLDECFSSPADIRRSHEVQSLEMLFAAHREACAALGTQAMPEAPDLPAWVDRLDAYWGRFLGDLVRRGWMRRDADASLRLRLAKYPAFFRALTRTPKAPPPGEVPMARQLALLAEHERVREQAPGPGVQWGLALAVTAVFAVFLALVIGDGASARFHRWLAFWIALTFVLHEAGRYLAMRAMGWRGAVLPPLALLGERRPGVDPAPSGARRALVGLAATLPGVLLGWAWLTLWFGAPDFAGVVVNMVALTETQPWLLPGALVPLLVNYAALLPLPAFEGGRIVQALLPRRWQWLVFALAGAALAGLLVFAWRLGFWSFVLVALWQTWVWRGALREARLLRQGAKIEPGPERDALLLALCTRARPAAGLARRFEQMLALRARLDEAPPTPGVGIGLLLLYLAPFALVLLHPVGQGVVWVLRVWGTA
ncbi:M50 family metallopeptidase [Comamonas sp. NLF-1-9]|uniref:M50 family metallopeptidase n=1 Tax=Comamonas sp. NLF-1-9 TaxID=2853163 RepID=UPI001C43BFD4|nr:M50 family metallopeptidase [Comamonas sp. NLF-1-9]QXL83517.1 M50 family metallopeptidase [Comamonas sp. NLF-1-9]